MWDILTLDFDNAKSGSVYKTPGYVAYVGWDKCVTGQYASVGWKWRAFFSFDTSAIPDHAQLEIVSFRCRRAGDPIGEPEDYSLKFSIGAFIGDALDGNAEEFDGGTLMATLDAKPADKDLIDLAQDGQDPFPHINKSGYTDVKVWDDSIQGSGDVSWSTNFNTDTDTRCKLEVVFSVPSATVTVKGYASLAATVIRGASATATGRFSSELAAAVIVSAKATATGVAGAELAAGVLLASASCDVTGKGYASMAAGVVRGSAAATVVGRSHASLAATVIHGASGTATANASAGLSAGVLRSTAAATVTARAFASCAITLAVPPLAVHSASLTFRGSDSATRTVDLAHTGEIEFDNQDTADREPRRVS